MITIHGAGIAGCTAALLLTRAGHKVRVYEQDTRVGGLAFDRDGHQVYGPHVLHTDDAEVWALVKSVSPMYEFILHVYAMQPPGLIEIPRNFDPILDIYSFKAWGNCKGARERMKPREINAGYVPDRYQGIPQGGFSEWCTKCLEGVDVRCCEWQQPVKGDIWTGALDNLPHGLGFLPWRGRQFVSSKGYLPKMIINYGTFDVPQLRSWDNALFAPFYKAMVGTEFFSNAGKHYPMEEGQEQADEMRKWAESQGIILLGRSASYRYMDMDHVIRQVMDTLKAKGLI